MEGGSPTFCLRACGRPPGPRVLGYGPSRHAVQALGRTRTEAHCAARLCNAYVPTSRYFRRWDAGLAEQFRHGFYALRPRELGLTITVKREIPRPCVQVLARRFRLYIGYCEHFWSVLLKRMVAASALGP